MVPSGRQYNQAAGRVGEAREVGVSVRPEKSPGLSFLAVLAMLTFIGPLSLHFFFPALPTIKAEFGVGQSIAQLAVTLPMFAMALLTLVYGSVSDRLGRRAVLFAGLALFIAGGALAAVSGSVWTLIAARLVQAAGGACGLVLARTIARDVYGTDRLVRAMAYLQMAYALAPMAALPLGGLLVDIYGWRAVMAAAAGAGFVILTLTFLAMHETHRPAPAKSVRRSVVADYVSLLGNLRFSAFVFQSCGVSGAFFAMATGAAFLMGEYLNRPAAEYGLYFMAFPAGYILGNFISSRLSNRVAIEPMVLVGGTLVLLAVAGQAGLILWGRLTPAVIFIPGFVVTLAQGFSLPNGQTGAFREAGALAGTGAGIGVFLQMFSAGAFSQMLGLLADGTPVPMVIAVSSAALLSFAAAVLAFMLRRHETVHGSA